ncbi:MAG: deoxyribodipyrimidine photolyase [Planctomycetota bacterium]
MNSDVPESRIRVYGDKPVDSDGKFVLYWMIANRRAHWNYSLDRAVDWSEELGLPLVVLEALRCDYRWASDRLHKFIIEGMQDNAADFDRAGVTYYPYLEQKPGDGRGLVKALAEKAAVVVSDDFPCFFLPAMLRAARRQIPVRFELIDSNGIYPMRETDRVFSRAYDFRRHLQKNLKPHLAESPAENSLEGIDLPRAFPLYDNFTDQWPIADLDHAIDHLDEFPIDHDVKPAPDKGGSEAAQERLKLFVKKRLDNYENRNQPEEDAASELSAYLHFGHISAHQVFAAVADEDGWAPNKLSDKTSGSSSGWWGGSEYFESFLDELITWRELGYNRCALTNDFDQYESLPDWAQETLAEHADDPRDHIYSLEEFEQAKTHDELWNAAQRQLVLEGRIHNYMRMLWGKKILEWTESPRDALEVMVELNNKYALDGRNPNSYSGIFWVLGRYDRAWGPERPIFGKIRFMSSDSAARKLRLKQYVARYNDGERSLFD